MPSASRLSPEEIWGMSDQEILGTIDKRIFDRKRDVGFYAPSFMQYKTRRFHSSLADFPTISITGDACALNCKHCGGKVLKTMHGATTPSDLFELCSKLKAAGASGCLVSGGCLPDGSVPLELFLPSIHRIKKELGLTIFVHTGLVNQSAALELRETGVDAALIDVIGSDETIDKIYNLKRTAQDYEDSLRALSEARIPFVPHVIIGLHYGRLKGEKHALEMISKYPPSGLVLIAFMPIKNTEMAKTKPPAPIEIARTILAAKLLIPNVPVALGCMRPRGRHRDRTDILALKAGVDAIAFPSSEAIEFAEGQGHNVYFSSACCSQVFKHTKRSSLD